MPKSLFTLQDDGPIEWGVVPEMALCLPLNFCTTWTWVYPICKRNFWFHICFRDFFINVSMYGKWKRVGRSLAQMKKAVLRECNSFLPAIQQNTESAERRSDYLQKDVSMS